MNFLTLFIRLQILLMGLACATQIFAQSPCDSTAIEIPNNAIDEDCDGLDDLFLELPPYIYLLENQDFELYFRNVFVSTHPEDYTIEVTTPVGGTQLADRWQYIPDASAIGEHPFEMRIVHQGDTLAESTSILRITAAASLDTARTFSAFLLGHSFIDQGYMPTYMKRLTTQPDNAKFTFHGSRASWIDNTRHEALGGASWQYYYDNPASPFFFDGKFDMRRYLDTFLCTDCAPSYFIIHLDVNDFCFPGFITGNDIDSIDNYIDAINLRFTQPFLAALRAEAPDTKIAISLAPPPNGRDTTWVNFFGAQSVLSSRYRWEKITARINHKYAEFFANKEDENIWILPIHLDIDDIVDFGPDDPVHPHPDVNTLEPPSGYLEIAKETFAWMKYAEPFVTSTIRNPKVSKVGLGVFPNPTESALFVRVQEMSENYGTRKITAVQVTDAIGRKRNTPFENIKGGTFDLKIETQGLNAGVYFLSIVFADGKQGSAVFVKK